MIDRADLSKAPSTNIQASKGKSAAAGPQADTAAPRGVIGRWVRIKWDGRICEAIVIDRVAGTQNAKRVRVQWPKEQQGEVVMRGQYEVMEFLD